MRVDIHSGPAFALGEITLPAGGAVRVEAGAMAVTRGDIQMSTSTRGGFMKGLRYGVRKAGGWKSSILGGEGLVTDFTGPGRVWFQTRNVSDFVQWMISKMPAQRSS